MGFSGVLPDVMHPDYGPFQIRRQQKPGRAMTVLMATRAPPRSLPVLGSGAVLGVLTPEKGERKDARENRARILAAARKLMKKRPLADICMDEVAELAGVGKGTLYRRFADRSALLLALLDEDERLLQDAVIAGFGLARDATAGARLCRLFDALIDFHIAHAPVLAAAENSDNTGSRFEHPTYTWRHTALVRGFVECGLARGDHAGHVADVVLASISGEVLARALTAQPADIVKKQTRAVFDAIVSTAGVKGDA
jgi:AcrR family transcriptional regulator